MAEKRNKNQMNNSVSSTLNELLILQAGGEIPSQILQSLRDKRLVTKIITNFSQVANAVQSLTEPVLVVESGTSEAKLDAAAKELGKLAPNFSLPVILIGDGAEAYERALDKLFPAATTLNTPYGTAEILAAINYLSRSYSERKARRLTEQAKSQERDKLSSVSHKAFEDFKTIPAVVFQQLHKLDLWTKDLGGSLFSNGPLEIAELKKLNMLPKDTVVTKTIETVCVDAGKWGRSHLARVSYTAQKLLSALGSDEALLENAKIAAVLYAWSFAGDNPELLKKSYIEAKSPQLRLELCSKIKDSAMQIHSQLKFEQAGSIAAIMARLIGKEQALSDEDPVITASAIMTADLIDRTCYQFGFWNPRRANQLLTRFKSGKFEEIHPAVLCCAVKFLAEAIASHVPLFLLPKEMRINKALIAQLEKAAKAPVGKNEKRVEICQLTPGMKLSQPLVAMDGKEILSPDIKLDEDLIWRIWQLSAIKPLNAPIIINSKN